MTEATQYLAELPIEVQAGQTLILEIATKEGQVAPPDATASLTFGIRYKDDQIPGSLTNRSLSVVDSAGKETELPLRLIGGKVTTDPVKLAPATYQLVLNVMPDGASAQFRERQLEAPKATPDKWFGISRPANVRSDSLYRLSADAGPLSYWDFDHYTASATWAESKKLPDPQNKHIFADDEPAALPRYTTGDERMDAVATTDLIRPLEILHHSKANSRNTIHQAWRVDVFREERAQGAPTGLGKKAFIWPVYDGKVYLQVISTSITTTRGTTPVVEAVTTSLGDYVTKADVQEIPTRLLGISVVDNISGLTTLFTNDSRFATRKILGISSTNPADIEIALRFSNGVPAKPGQQQLCFRDIVSNGPLTAAEFDIQVENDANGMAQAKIRLNAEALRWYFSEVGVTPTISLVEIYAIVGDERLTANELIFPAQQRVIFFIPGVAGSHIWVSEKNPPDNTVSNPDADGVLQAWARLSDIALPGPWETGLTYLVCNIDGQPFRKAIKTETIHNIGSAPIFNKTIYEIHKVVGSAEQTLFNDIEKSGSWLENARVAPAMEILGQGNQRVPFKRFVYEELGYDWRLDLETHSTSLLRSISAARDLDSRNIEYPFLEKSVAVACHSTGGLIVRGILSKISDLPADSPERTLISHAYFLNVPFWGAPKAEVAYLTGDFETFVASTPVRMIAPDMPVFYALSPLGRYGEADCLRTNNLSASSAEQHDKDYWSRPARKARIDKYKQTPLNLNRQQVAIANGETLYNPKRTALVGWPGWENRTLANGALAPRMLEFNDALAGGAEGFQSNNQQHNDAIRQLGINVFVFHSYGRDTPMGTRIFLHEDRDSTSPHNTSVVTGYTNIIEKVMQSEGDGTVPSISMIADIGEWDSSVKDETRAHLMKCLDGKGVNHVDAPNKEWVWVAILKSLLGWQPDQGDKRPWPLVNGKTDMQQLVDLAEHIAKGEE